MGEELLGLSLLLAVSVFGGLAPVLWLGLGDPRAMFVAPFGVMGTLIVPFAI